MKTLILVIIAWFAGLWFGYEIGTAPNHDEGD